MARRKKPARQRWTNVKNSMLYFAWAMDKRPDSSIMNLIRFLERAIQLEEKWIKGDGLREFEERNKMRDAARARYRQLFDEKYSLTNPDRIYFNGKKDKELKEVTKFLDDQHVLNDEFHIRNNEFLAALFFLMHSRSRQVYADSDKLTPPYTSLN